MSMSLIAASQNHSRSASARRSSSAYEAMSCRTMNCFRRLRAITSSLGSQITSPMTTGCIAPDSRVVMPTLRTMEPLPPDFARQLAEVLEPGAEGAAAQVIKAAIRLDDARLSHFLDLLAERIRASHRRITPAELRGFLRASTGAGPAGS